MLKIYGHTNSINVRKVLWLCDELGLPYVQEDWGGGTRSVDEPEFRRLNPFGVVPVIENDGAIIRESNTILRYLARKYGGISLLPAGPLRRAQVEQWMDWQATDLNSAWRYAFLGLVRKNANFQDKDSIATSIAQWTVQMRLLDQELTNAHPYVCGPQFTLADIPVGLSVNRWFMTPIDRPELPAVTRYYDLLTLRRPFVIHGRNGRP